MVQPSSSFAVLGDASTSTFSTAHRSLKLDGNDVVRTDVVLVADDDDDEHVASLGIVGVADAVNRCYHHSLYLINCYLIDY